MATSKPVLAICFLAVRDVENMDLWRSWWAGHEDQVALYAHVSPGKRSNVKDHDLGAAMRRVPGAVPTKWGDVSLVRAEAVLYRAALKSKRNTFFLLASETCVPVRPFREVMARLMRAPTKGIMDLRSERDGFCPGGASDTGSDASLSCRAACLAKMRALGFAREGAAIWHAPQWKVLSRPNAMDFCDMVFAARHRAWMRDFKACQVIAPREIAADEFMFASFLSVKYGRRGGGPWWDAARIRRGLVTAAAFKSPIHPVTYKGSGAGSCIHHEICSTGAMFARKFKRLANQTWDAERWACPPSKSDRLYSMACWADE